jgi:hypothetical protein
MKRISATASGEGVRGLDTPTGYDVKTVARVVPAFQVKSPEAGRLRFSFSEAFISELLLG